MSGLSQESVTKLPRENASCPACGHAGMDVFFQVERAPILCNVLWDSRQEALAVPCAPIRLGFCPQCSMVRNIDFDASLLQYSARYENSLHYSPRFERYAEELARHLVDRYGLQGKDVVEIGCGQGDFLALLAKLGDNRAVGYDPGYDPGRASRAAEAGVTIYREHYSEAHAARPADLVCCRQVLEHLDQPLEFLRSLRRAIAGRRETVVFLEVPDALYTLRDLGIWDIIYEHCSYFTPGAISRLFRQAGFDVLDVAERYGKQFISVEARPSLNGRAAAPAADQGQLDVSELVGRFAEAYEAKLRLWRTRMAELAAANRSAVLWGAGSKGITFLNVTGISHEQLKFVVDVNPHKHGRFITGTGQQIVAPEFLRDDPPDVIVIMNPIYRAEIEQTVEKLGVRAEIVVA